MTEAISNEKLSELIGHIYDCALDPGHWPATMQHICQELNLRTGVVSLISLPDGAPILAASTGFEKDWLDRVFAYPAELVELWGGHEVIAAQPLDAPAVLSLVNPQAIGQNSQDRFHLEFNRPQGFVDAIAVGVTRDDASIGTIGFNRHQDAGLITEREIEVMRLLLPHLQRAVTVSRVLDVSRIAATSMRAALDALSAPVVLVARDMTRHFANRAATTAFAQSGGFEQNSGTVRLPCQTAQRAVEQTLKAFGEGGWSPDPFGIPIAATGSNLRKVHVLPLNSQPDETAKQLFALVFSTGQASLETGVQALTVSAGLTEAERRVVAEIAGGSTVKAAARNLAIAPSTVRTHLLSIFGKTGVARQAELVARVAAFADPRP